MQFLDSLMAKMMLANYGTGTSEDLDRLRINVRWRWKGYPKSGFISNKLSEVVGREWREY